MKNLRLLILALFIISCKKTSTPDTVTNDNNGKYLTKISSWTPSSNNEQVAYEIAVNTNGDLTGFKSYSSGVVYINLTSFEKNTGGKIIKASGTVNQANSIICTFEYDSNGNLIKSTNTQGTTLLSIITYTYDNNNRLLTVDQHDGANNPTTLSTYTYSGNAVSPVTERVDQRSDPNAKSITYTFQFDDKKNPTQATFSILPILISRDELFYKNNIVSKSTSGSSLVQNFTYEYNGNGFATSQKINNVGIPTDVGFKYYYGQ